MIQIFYDIDTMRRVNADGAPITVLPAFYYNTAPVVQFQFMNNGTPIDLSGIAGWRAAIDTDFNSSSDPAVRVTADGIDASQSASGILSVTFDCRSAEFLTKLNNNRTVTAWLDIYGIDGSGISAFIAQMQVQLFSVVDPEQGTPPVIPDLYPSSAAVQAMVNAAVAELLTKIEAPHIYQYSADGSSWHDTFQTGDIYMRERANFDGAQWSDAYRISPPTVFTNAIEYNFDTTAGQSAAITFTAAELGIAADAQPQVSLWVYQSDADAWQRVADTTYTAKWSLADGSLTIEYYQAWIAGSWQLKLS